MLGRISSMMESARGSVEELLQTIVDEGAETRGPGEGPASRHSSQRLSGASRAAAGPSTRTFRTDQEPGRTGTGEKMKAQSRARMASSGMLDPSVSHETYGFIQTLMQDPASAKKLFFSYDKILARRPTTAKFSMTKEQNQHARSIIQAIPEFDKLRFTLAPSYMPDNRFWEVYFTLIWEKHCVGASKGEEYDADPSDESAYSTLTRPSSRLAPARGSRSEAKEEVVTPEDLSKGMKREREDSMDNNSDIAGDIAIVSRLLFNGARRTFQFAEQFIEAMDERASSASATTPANDATKPPTTGTASSATAPTASLASSKKSDAKRGRFEASADSNLFPAPEDKLKDCDVEPNVAAGDTSDGAETDGFSVASVDDADLHEWATVSPSPRSRKTLTVPSLGTEDVDHVEDFEWI